MSLIFLDFMKKEYTIHMSTIIDYINTFLNFLISGHPLSIEENGRRKLLVVFLLMIIPADIIYGILHFIGGSRIVAGLDLFLALVMTFIVITLRKLNNITLIYRLVIFLYSMPLFYFIKSGTAYGYGVIWVMFYPLFAFFLLGKKEGFLWTAVFTLVMMALLVNPGSLLSDYTYSSQFISRLIPTYAMIVIFTYSYERVREKYKLAMEAEHNKLALEKEKLSQAKEEVERANRLLKEEMALKEQVETELRRHRNHLEDIVTERTAEIKQNNEKLKVSEERYRLMADNVNDLIWAADLNLVFTFLSPSVYRLYGYTVDEAIKLSPEKWNTPESFNKIKKAYSEEMNLEKAGKSEPGKYVVLHLEQRKKDGTLFPVELKVSTIKDEKGKTVGFVGITRDISDRIAVERESKKLQEQLHQAQKMDSVGRLAGGVAHDFNNMLGVILGRLELAMRAMDPSQSQYQNLLEIRKAAERSAELTRQLLAFARKQTVAPSMLDLNRTVEGMLNMLRRLIGEDIDLAWLPGKDLSAVKIDPSQIDQIMANLCVNARDAITGIGKVTIATANVFIDEGTYAEHPGVVPGDYVMLSVTDNGCGMDAQTLNKLFEPFFTTKETGKGTGLGLATVYGIVKQNSGFINVGSKPGSGSTFTVYLPRCEGMIEPVQQKDFTAAPVAQNGETVLLVEDEPAILDMTTLILESLGYIVLPAETAARAIRLAGEHTGKINLLITDVIMPEMNGRDLAGKLLSLYPNLKCLFISGYTADIIARHGILDSHLNFIQKPFTRQQLAAKLREVLDGSKMGQ